MDLPATKKTVRHHSAIAYHAAPDFIEALKTKKASSSRYTLQMLLLNSCRSGKVRGTTCDEIGTEVIGGLPSAEFQVWAIVAKRMKAGREHVAPLNTAGFTVIATARVRQHNTLLL